MTPNELARLIQEDVKKRLEESASREPVTVPEEILQDVELIKKDFIEKVPDIDEYEKIVKAQESDYPPCITYLVKEYPKESIFPILKDSLW